MGEVEVEHGGFELGMAQVALDEPGVHARFEQMGGVGRPEGRDGSPPCGKTGPVCGGTAGALAPGAPHGGGRCRTVVVIPPGGGKEPRRVPGSFPGGAEPQERLCRQGDVPVCGALPTMALGLEALAIAGRDLQGAGVVEPEAPARDGGTGRVVVAGGGGRAESRDLLHTEDGGEPVGGVHAQEREGVPVAPEDVLGEEAEPLEQRRRDAGAKPSTWWRWRKECWSACAAMRSGDVWEHWASRRTSRTEDACVRSPLPLRGRAAIRC